MALYTKSIPRTRQRTSIGAVQPGLELYTPEICRGEHWDRGRGDRPGTRGNHPQTRGGSANRIGAAEGATLQCAPVGTSELPRVSPEQGEGPQKVCCGLVWPYAHLRSAKWHIGTADEGNSLGTREGGRPKTSRESTNRIGVAEGEPLEHQREAAGAPVGTSKLPRASPEHDGGPRKAWYGLV
ncbi:hypothetical protein NDU88_008841 [Pleurodeles waltl]|uniref:Uncharacterized protein n=1 Tax=Pleurodeles waltl TaxID=8319 RepID=A0AAV7P1F9_PLEWA|nr:hypothetical protein NDU88_008841 [Pleurodeles waltl]